MLSVKEIRKSLYAKTVLAFLCISLIPLAIFSYITFQAVEESEEAISQEMEELKSLVEAITEDAKENQLGHVAAMRTKTEDSISKAYAIESDEVIFLESLYEQGLITGEGLEELEKYHSELDESLHVINYTVGQRTADLNENLELASSLIEGDIRSSILSHQKKMDRLFLKTTYILAAFWVLVVVSVLVTSYVATESIVGPIRRLKEGVGEVSRGNLDYSFTVESEDEIGVLAQEFSRMVAGRKEAEEELCRRAEELATLLKASQRLATSLDLENVLQTSIDEAVKVTGMGTGAIYLLEGEMLRLYATTPPLPPQFPEELRLMPLADHPHIKQAIITRHPVTLEDTATADLTPAEKAVSEMRDLRTLLYVPLRGDETVMGVFILGSVGEPCVISEAQINLSLTLANLTALAAENARLYHGIKGVSEKLEERVKERTAALQNAQESLLSLVEDLTGAKEELEELNTRLQEADRLKSVFLASMSHELRTPLNSIIGFTGILLQGLAGDLNEEQAKQLDMVNSSAKHLLSLINDLLDVSKIEEGKMEPAPEEFYIGAVIEAVVGAFAPLIQKKELKLKKAVKDGKVYTDKRRFKQVLMNLLGNAIKFTPKGTVTINAAAGKDTVDVSVEDTGIGIKKEDMSKLFEPFQQIELPPEMTKDGTGLGLYLSRKIVAMLGGEIRAESTYKKRSIFSFSIPVRYKKERKN